MSVTDLQEEREKHGIPADGNVNGRTIAERAEEDFPHDAPESPDAEDEAAEQEELFVIEHGRRVPLSKLIAKNTPIEYSVNLNSKSFHGGDSMGLLPFNDADMLLVVPVRQGKVVIDPTYDEGGYVQKVSVRANLRPLTAHDVKSRDGRALLGQSEED